MCVFVRHTKATYPKPFNSVFTLPKMVLVVCKCTLFVCISNKNALQWQMFCLFIYLVSFLYFFEEIKSKKWNASFKASQICASRLVLKGSKIIWMLIYFLYEINTTEQPRHIFGCFFLVWKESKCNELFLYVLLISILITSIKIYTRPVWQHVTNIRPNFPTMRETHAKILDFIVLICRFLISICLNDYAAIAVSIVGGAAVAVVATDSIVVASFPKSICVFH